MSSKNVLTVQRSAERAFFDHGWLQTSHSFSFADYHDPANIHWGALRVFNDDIVQPAQGFGTHPHRDMEILTYVLDGELTHRDSMGNVRTVTSGGVQYLSAGTGITHSEYNASSTTPCHLVQMWVVPTARGLQPRYGQVDFTAADRHGRWLVVASGRPGIEAPVTIWQDATCSVARLQQSSVSMQLETGRYAFLFLAKGELAVESPAHENLTLHAGDALRLRDALDLQLHGDGELILWDIPAMPL